MKRWIMMVVAMCTLTAQAQFGSFYSDQPFLAENRLLSSPDAIINSYSSNLFRRWVSSDVALGSASVWTDRVTGHVLAQGESAKQPLSTASGMFFNGATYFTNIICDPNPTLGSTLTNLWLIILNCTNVSVDNIVTSDSDVGATFKGLDVGRNSHWFIIWDAGAAYTAPYIADNTWYDWMIYHNGHITNGVYSKDYPTDNWAYQRFVNVGRRSDNIWQFRGWIREINIWTNFHTGTNLDITSRSNFHYYATNKYGYSP